MEYEVLLGDPACEVLVADPRTAEPLAEGAEVGVAIDPAGVALVPVATDPARCGRPQDRP